MTAVSLATRSLPGTYLALNKYFLDEWTFERLPGCFSSFLNLVSYFWLLFECMATLNCNNFLENKSHWPQHGIICTLEGPRHPLYRGNLRWPLWLQLLSLERLLQRTRQLQGLVLFLLLSSPPLMVHQFNFCEAQHNIYQIKDEHIPNQGVEHKIISFVKIEVGWPAGHSLYQTSSSTEKYRGFWQAVPHSAMAGCYPLSCCLCICDQLILWCDVFMYFRKENIW